MPTVLEYLQQKGMGPEELTAAQRRLEARGITMDMDASAAVSALAPSRDLNLYAPQATPPQTAPAEETPRLTWSNPGPFDWRGLGSTAKDTLYDMVRPGQQWENVPGQLATLGTVGGGMLGGPPGALLGGGLLGGTAEIARQRLLGEEPNPALVFNNVAIPIATEGLSSAVIRALGPNVKRWLRPGNQEVVGLAKGLNIKQSAAEQINSQGLGTMEAGAAKFPLARGPALEAWEARQGTHRRAIQDFSYPKGSTPDPTVRGGDIQRPIKIASDAAYGQSDINYQAVYKAAGTDPVPAANALAALRGIRERLKTEIPPEVRGLLNDMEVDLIDKRAIRLREKAIAEAITPMAGLPAGPQKDAIIRQTIEHRLAQLPPVEKPVPFERLHGLSKRIAAEARIPGRPAPVYNILNELRTGVETDLAAFAEPRPVVGPALAHAREWHQANIGTPYDPGGSTTKAPIFGQGSFAQHLMDLKPEEVPGAIRTATQARQLRTALAHDPVARENVSQAVTQRMMDAAVDTKTELVDPIKFLRQLEQYPAETRALIWGPERADALAGLEKVLVRHARLSHSFATPSPWAAQALPTGIAMTVGHFMGGYPGAAMGGAATLLAPPLFVRFINSEFGTKLLTQGFLQPNMTQHAVLRLIEQLTAHELTRSATTPVR